MELRKRTLVGFAWAGTSQFGRQAVQLLLTLTLARLLLPSDYGLIGIAGVFVGFFSLFGGLGFESAIIQKREISPLQLNSVFWGNIAVSSALALVLCGFSGYIADFYGMSQLSGVVRALSAGLVIAALGQVHHSLLTKEMRFKEIALRDIVSLALSGVIGIALAFAGFGVWSLVVQALLFHVISACMFWTLYRWRPSLRASLSSLGGISRFAFNVMGFRISSYWARNIDTLLIGKLLGAVSLGYYSLAYKIMLFPLQNFASVIGQVLFPAISEIQNDKNRVADVYLDMIKGISLITYPLMMFVAGASGELVGVAFGVKWLPAAGIVAILSFCGAVQSTLSPCGNFIIALGRADLQFRFGLIGAVWAVVTIFAGARWGLYGISIAYAAGQIVWALIVHGTLMTYLTATPVSRYLKSLKSSILVSFLVFFAVRYMHPAGFGMTGILLAKASSALFIYAAFIGISGEYKFFLRQLQSKG